MRLQLKRALAALVVLSLAPVARAQDWRIAYDSLVYDDTDNVTVVTPRLSVRRRLDEEGGSVGAHALVDVVSAASVDVVSHATPSFFEARSEAGFDVVKPFGDHLPSAAYRFSIEPDYLSNGGHLGWTSRLGTPDSVLSVGYALTHDLVARSGTPWSTFSRDLFTHAADVSFTQTLDPETVLRGAYTLTIQHGYMEKPYRHVPLFDAATVLALESDGQRIDFDSFDQYRLPMRPPEEVPDLRVRQAIGARVLRSIDPIEGSIRGDYSFYFDDWGMTAHAVEAALTGTIMRGLRLVGYGRFYLQTAASFWRRTYVVDGNDEVPRWRSLDRDLSDYYSISGGARVEWAIEQEWSGYADGYVMWTHFDSFLLLDERTALVGQVGLRWTPP